MIEKLSPQQVAVVWDEIKQKIRSQVAWETSDTERTLTNVLREIVSKKMQCWVASKVVKETKEVCGLLLTRINYDVIAEEKTLLIYAVYSFGFYKNDDWIDSFNVVRRYAKENGCKKMTAYSDNRRILDVSQSVLNGNIDKRYIVFEV